MRTVKEKRETTKSVKPRGKTLQKDALPERAPGEKMEPGTVIGVDRGLYKHYAIYAGRKTVIHYASKTGDFGGDMSVKKAGFEYFLNGSTRFFVCEFPDSHGRPRESERNAGFIASLASAFGGNEDILSRRDNPLAALLDIYEFFKKINYKLYSPAETLRRAKSRLGESSYSLVFNNCEHFVVWCKTGVSESHQVNHIIKAIAGRDAV